MEAPIPELDGRPVDTLDEAFLLESVDRVPVRIQLSGFSQRCAEVANDIPSRRTVPRWLGIVDAVVRILQVGAVQHQQHNEQALQFTSTAERIVGPTPHLFCANQIWKLGSEPSLAYDRRLAVSGIEPPGRQVVNGRLMVAEPPQYARQDDFGLRFGPDLRAPFHSIGPYHVVADAEAAGIFRLQLVHGVRWRRVLLSTNTPEQIPKMIARINAELRGDIRRHRSARCHDDGAAACARDGDRGG